MTFKIIGDDIYFMGEHVATIEQDVLPTVRDAFLAELDWASDKRDPCSDDYIYD